MNTDFNKIGFSIVKNFIDSDTVELIKNTLRKSSKSSRCIDFQVPNAESLYGTPEIINILTKKSSEVSSLIGEDVIPTYAYSRIYSENSCLSKHTDRESCEVSLTIHLGGDCEWEFKIDGYDGKEYVITLNVGDAILYDGCNCPHERIGTYNGKEYLQTFFHYVRANGSNADHYFDKIHIRPEMSLKSHIKIYNNVVDETFCDEILREYSESNEWGKALTNGEVMGGQLETENIIRNCNSILISQNCVIGDNEKRRYIDNKLFEVFNWVLKQYNSAYPFVDITEDTGYELLRYEGGEYYKQHVDDSLQTPRTFSASLLLNDNFDGGQFSFFNGKEEFNLKKGSVICFPSNFLYPHQIVPVTKGVRYSIVTWFH